MITINSQEILQLIASFIWPLTRILAFIASCPPFGNNGVPVQAKIILGVFIALIIAPTISFNSPIDFFSLQSIGILLQEFLIGISIGFVVRLIFAGIEMAGEVSGLTMGLGFATFFDPQTHGRSSAISQLLVLLTTLLFLTLNIHLSLIEALIHSFNSIPIFTELGSKFPFQNLALWGKEIFKIGAILAMPIMAALLITNIALGILTRAAPQLNIFGIGFPITIIAGFVTLTLIITNLLNPTEVIFQEMLVLIHNMLKIQ